jgi:acetyltransferase-like isoleucine patch superfamily enzyme
MAPVRIGDKAFIGCNVLILKGVTIGEGAVIGAGSVVTRDIAPWHVAAGNPCRELRPVAPARPG